MLLLSVPRFLWTLPRLLAAIVIIYGFLWIKSFPRELPTQPLPKNQDARTGYDDSNINQNPPADPDNVIVAIKTGATEAFDKLPSQLLLTNPRDFGNLLLFSDLEQDIGGFHLHDVLSRFNPDLMVNNSDFDIYRKQQEYARLGLDMRLLKDEKDPNPNWRTKGHNAAWALDKYKFLHMLELAWELRPERDWYVFIETDTYLMRSNLYGWLGQFDPKTPYYFGNPTRNPHYNDGDTYPFAHGGSGIVLSGAALRWFAVNNRGAAGRWDADIADMWFGGYVVAAALYEELGLNITGVWPLLSGFKPTTVPYGPDVWCKAVVALHHVLPEENSAIWRFEREREDFRHINTPLLFEELWKQFIQNEDLSAPRDNWDNLSNDFTNVQYNILFKNRDPPKNPKHRRSEMKPTPPLEKPAPPSGKPAPPKEAPAFLGPEASADDCAKACETQDQCMQWSYSSKPAPNFNENGETKCHLSTSFRLGSRRMPEDVSGKNETNVQRTWRSGWRKDKFWSWAEQHRCNNIT